MARTILVLILLTAALAGCGSDDESASDERRDVIAAFYPLAWAAERVGGDTVDVRNLTPPGTEPHDLELSPRDVEAIRSADVVLYIGKGFQPTVEDALEGAGGEAVDLLAGQQLLSGEAHAGEEGESEEAHETESDPHVWLDPIRMREIADRIGTALGRPGEAAALDRELRTLDGDFQRGLANCERREVVTSHAAFGYLAARYGLEQIPITGLSPEAEPTPQHVAEIAALARQRCVTTIFFETLVSPKIAQTVATEIGAKADVPDPIEGLKPGSADTYLTVMRANLAR